MRRQNTVLPRIVLLVLFVAVLSAVTASQAIKDLRAEPGAAEEAARKVDQCFDGFLTEF